MSQDKPIFCPSCGEKNMEDAIYCMICGSSLPKRSTESRGNLGYDSQPAKSTQTGQGQQRTPYQPPSSQNRRPGEVSPPYPNQSPRPAYNQAFDYNKIEKPNIFGYVCSFCFPPVGLILFFYYRQDHPGAAKDIIILAIVATFIYILGNA